MARKAAVKTKRKEAGRRSEAIEAKPKSQVPILVYKADPQTADPFKEWLIGLAEHVGAPVTITVDMALKHFAEARKFRPMPKRLAR